MHSRNTQEEIQAAFVRLPIKAGVQWKIGLLGAMLSALADCSNAAVRIPPSFRSANRNTCIKELKRIKLQSARLVELCERPNLKPGNRARFARMLKGTIEDLHQPTILALSDVGFERTLVVCVGEICERLVQDNCLVSERELLILHLAAVKASRADAQAIDSAPCRGRPGNGLPASIVEILFNAYSDLTGTSPTRTTRSDKQGSPAAGFFVDLVRDVFSALQIDASAEASVRTAFRQKG